jgi:hypothetical protein
MNEYIRMNEGWPMDKMSIVQVGFLYVYELGETSQLKSLKTGKLVGMSIFFVSLFNYLDEKKWYIIERFPRDF